MAQLAEPAAGIGAGVGVGAAAGIGAGAAAEPEPTPGALGGALISCISGFSSGVVEIVATNPMRPARISTTPILPSTEALVWQPLSGMPGMDRSQSAPLLIRPSITMPAPSVTPSPSFANVRARGFSGKQPVETSDSVRASATARMSPVVSEDMPTAGGALRR